MMRRAGFASMLVAAVGIAAGLFAGPMVSAARADDFINQVNATYAKVPGEKSAEAVLFPLLIKLPPPPAALRDAKTAAFMPATSSEWAAVKQWTEGETQKSLIEALEKITKEADFRKAYAFSLPYGADATEKIDPKYIEMKMYTELGEPALLAQADFLYLPRLTWLQMLCHATATRLQADGKPDDALKVMTNLTYLGRMMADREMQTEKQWGMSCMAMGLMRIRDIAYIDSRLDTPLLTAEQVRDVIKRLSKRDYLNVDRLSPPEGNRQAALQLVAAVMKDGAGPDPERWSVFLSRILSKNRPLRMFSEAAKWDALRDLHANTAETRKMVEGVYRDFFLRWRLPAFDAKHKIPTDYQRLNRAQYALVDSMVPEMDALTTLRTSLFVESAGTRMSLGVYAYRLANRNLPPAISSTMPRIISELDIDPFDPRSKAGYWYRPVPPGEQPFKLDIFPEILGQRGGQFSFTIREMNFLLYSVGPDGNDNACRRATQNIRDENADYLIWPPVLSLYRQNLTESGQFK